MTKTTEEACSCLELAEMLSDYVDGELDDETRSVVEKHLDGCALCSADVTLMRGITENLEAIPEETPPADFARSVAMAALPRKKAPAPGFFRRLAALFTLPRATVLVGGVALLALLFMGPPLPMAPSGPQLAQAPTTSSDTELVASAGVLLDGRSVLGTTPVKAGQQIEAHGTGRSVLTFANRTRVTFGQDTELACLDKSVMLSEGIVSVDVPSKSPDRKTPSFRVLTPNARFTVWGTRFTVRCQKRNGKCCSTLDVQEGLVGVERMQDGRVTGAEKMVRAGQGARVEQDVQVRRPTDEPAADTATGTTSEDTSIRLGQDD